MKITEKHWEIITKYLPAEIKYEIEEDIRLSNMKLPQVTVLIKWGEEDKEIICEKLNDFWCISPAINKDGSLHKTLRSITHINSGQYTLIFKNRKEALSKWEKVKHLDINYDNVNDITKSKDSELFKQILRGCE